MFEMNKITKAVFILLLTGLLLSAQYCKDGSDPGDDKYVIPDSDISFIDHIAPMLEFYCGTDRGGTGGGCHSPLSNDKRFMYQHLTVKVSLMNFQFSDAARMIDLRNHQDQPQAAPFYILVTRGYPQDEDIMPPILYKQLNENQTEGIKRWIAEGAPD